jgi:hypothetical protein
MSFDEPQSLLAALEGRRFSFYPAIRGIKHNEWTLEGSSWSEVQVRNGESGQQFWIPRSHLGVVSSSDSPVLILGLRRELEFKAGGVYPFRKVVTEMPSTQAGREPQAPATPPPKQRSLSVSDARALRLLGLALGVGLLVSALVFAGVIGGMHNPFEALFQPDTSTADQRYLGLGSSASYFEVVDRLERPESELWISAEEDELQFQALYYPSRGYIVIMMGGSRAEMRYIGTVHDRSRSVLDSARLARGGDTSSMMRNLPGF